MKYFINGRGDRYADFERASLWIPSPAELWLLPGNPRQGGGSGESEGGETGSPRPSTFAAKAPPPCPQRLAPAGGSPKPRGLREPVLLLSTSPVTTTFVSVAETRDEEGAPAFRLRLLMHALLLGVTAQLVSLGDAPDYLCECSAVFKAGQCLLRFGTGAPGLPRFLCLNFW